MFLNTNLYKVLKSIQKEIDGKIFGKYHVSLILYENCLKFYMFFISDFDVRELEEYKENEREENLSFALHFNIADS